MKKTKSILQTLAMRSFKANRTRNQVAILAIVMTTLMFTSLFVLSQSLSKNLLQMSFRQSGYDAEVSFKTITEEQAEKIAAHPYVQELGNSIVLGLGENEELTGQQVEIRWGDDSYASHCFAFPSTGRMPETYDEIALDILTLNRLGIPHRLGEAVTLQWRKDTSKDEMISQDFILCGYWDGNQSSYASMAWVSRDYANDMTDGRTVRDEAQVLGLHMAQVSLKGDRNIEAAMDGILKDTGLSGLEYSVNLAYSPELNAMAAQESIPMYIGMFLVFLAGYLIIYNIFQISVTADIQFYGKLKTLGTSTKQLKKLIYGQANRLCIIAIPIGLFLGYLLGMVLVPVLLGSHAQESTVSGSPVIFIGSALFAWLTVIISCLRPARLAGKVSPMEALRYSDAGTASKKKKKKKHSGASLYSMAFANLGRNKKRTVMVICSLSLGLVLLSCFYAKDAAFDMEKYLSELTISDFELADATDSAFAAGYNPQGSTLDSTLLAQVEKLEGLEAMGKMYSHQTTFAIDTQTLANLTDYYTEDKQKDWEGYDPKGVEELNDAIAGREAAAIVYGLDGIPLDTVAQEQNILTGEYDAGEFSTGNYVLAISPSVSPSELLNGAQPPQASVGSKVTIDGETFTVMAVVCSVSSVDGGAKERGLPSSFHLEYVLPADAFQTIWPDNTLRKLFFNVGDEGIQAAQQMLDDYTREVDSSLPVTSRKTMEEQYLSETRSAAVIGNAISIVIALIGILNFVNSMVTAIISRKKEFAMIQSIGMTKRQLCQMLVFEGVDYAGITLLLSYIVSAFAVGTGVRAMTANEFSTFQFTLLPLLICTPVILGFAVLIPYVCFKNLEKQSVVERLRTL